MTSTAAPAWATSSSAVGKVYRQLPLDLAETRVFRELDYTAHSTADVRAGWLFGGSALPRFRWSRVRMNQYTLSDRSARIRLLAALLALAAGATAAVIAILLIHTVALA